MSGPLVCVSKGVLTNQLLVYQLFSIGTAYLTAKLYLCYLFISFFVFILFFVFIYFICIFFFIQICMNLFLFVCIYLIPITLLLLHLNFPNGINTSLSIYLSIYMSYEHTVCPLSCFVCIM